MRPWFAGGLLVLSLVAFPLVDLATGATTSRSIAYPSLVLTCIALAGYVLYLSVRGTKVRKQLRAARAMYPRHEMLAIAAETVLQGRFEQQILAIGADGIKFLRSDQARDFRWSEVETVSLERPPGSPPRAVIRLAEVGNIVIVPLNDRFLAARRDADLIAFVDLIDSHLSQARRV